MQSILPYKAYEINIATCSLSLIYSLSDQQEWMRKIETDSIKALQLHP